MISCFTRTITALKTFMHHVEKWPNILWKSCVVLTSRFLKYVWPFFSIMHDRVNSFSSENRNSKTFSHTDSKIALTFARIASTIAMKLFVHGCIIWCFYNSVFKKLLSWTHYLPSVIFFLENLEVRSARLSPSSAQLEKLFRVRKVSDFCDSFNIKVLEHFFLSNPHMCRIAPRGNCPNSEFFVVRIFRIHSILCPNEEKYWPKKNTNLDTFHAVPYTPVAKKKITSNQWG